MTTRLLSSSLSQHADDTRTAFYTTPLMRSDAPHVQRWLHDHLRAHLRRWAKAYKLGWSEQTIAQHIQRHRMIEEAWRDVLRAGSQEHRHLAVARSTLAPLGLVQMSTRKDRYLKLDVGVLQWLYVAPQARGGGVADALMRESQRWLTSRGLERSEVHVTASNTPAVKVYARHGYAPTDWRMLGAWDDEDDA